MANAEISVREKFAGRDQAKLLTKEGEHGFAIGMYYELKLNFKSSVDQVQ